MFVWSHDDEVLRRRDVIRKLRFHVLKKTTSQGHNSVNNVPTRGLGVECTGSVRRLAMEA